jgi:hypothetical protein
MCGSPTEMRTGFDGQKAIFAHAASTPREVSAGSIRALAKGTLVIATGMLRPTGLDKECRHSARLACLVVSILGAGLEADPNLKVLRSEFLEDIDWERCFLWQGILVRPKAVRPITLDVVDGH